MTPRPTRKALCAALVLAALCGCKDDKKKEETREVAAPVEAVKYRIRTRADGPGSVGLSPRRTTYASGARVTLTATPRQGAEFHGWSGDAAGESRSITVTMKGDLSVSARFDWPAEEQPVREAVEDLLRLSGEGSASAEDMEARIGAVANAYGDRRDALYEPVTKADEAFLEALHDCGEDAKSLANLDQLVLDEVGPWAFLAGRTASLRMLYERDPGLPHCDPAEFERAYERWRRATERAAQKLEDADRVPSYMLTPSLRRVDGDLVLSDSWRPTGHRREAFEQERRVYQTAARLTDDPKLKARLEEEAQALEDLRAVDDELVAIISGGDAPAATASSPREVSAPSSGLPAPTPTVRESSGATGALGRIR